MKPAEKRPIRCERIGPCPETAILLTARSERVEDGRSTHLCVRSEDVHVSARTRRLLRGSRPRGRRTERVNVRTATI